MKINPVGIGLFLWGALCLSVMAQDQDATSEDFSRFQKCVEAGKSLEKCWGELSIANASQQRADMMPKHDQTASPGTPLNHTTFQKCILSGRPLKECGEEMEDTDPLKGYIVNESSAYTGLFTEKDWGWLEGGIWSPTPAELSRYWMM